MPVWTPKLKAPVLTQRIPAPPFGGPKDRRVISYEEYAKRRRIRVRVRREQ